MGLWIIENLFCFGENFAVLGLLKKWSLMIGFFMHYLRSSSDSLTLRAILKVPKLARILRYLTICVFCCQTSYKSRIFFDGYQIIFSRNLLPFHVRKPPWQFQGLLTSFFLKSYRQRSAELGIFEVPKKYFVTDRKPQKILSKNKTLKIPSWNTIHFVKVWYDNNQDLCWLKCLLNKTEPQKI